VKVHIPPRIVKNKGKQHARAPRVRRGARYAAVLPVSASTRPLLLAHLCRDIARVEGLSKSVVGRHRDHRL